LQGPRLLAEYLPLRLPTLADATALEVKFSTIHPGLFNPDVVSASSEHFEHPINAPKRLVNEASFVRRTTWKRSAPSCAAAAT
jgi:hypothetical protein